MFLLSILKYKDPTSPYSLSPSHLHLNNFEPGTGQIFISCHKFSCQTQNNMKLKKMLKIQVGFFVLGNISLWILEEDTVIPDASQGPKECSWAPQRNTGHCRPSHWGHNPESTFCGQDKNQSPAALNVVTNISKQKMGRRQTSEKDNVDMVALVKIQCGVLLVITWIIIVVVRKVPSRS